MTETAITEVESWIPGGGLSRSETMHELSNPWSGQPSLKIAPAGAEGIEAAVAFAKNAFGENLGATVAQRSQWLNAAADAIEARIDSLVEMSISHIGKPRRAAEFETKRSAAFVRACARQIHDFGGEVLPLDSAPAGKDLFGFTRRVPYGVVAAITPFNAPANLLVQKVAPALVTGNAVIIKPCLEGSAIAIEIARAFEEAGLPESLLSVVTGHREEARLLAEHEDVALVTLTGGTKAGEALAKAAGAKPFVGELGGNSPNIVCADANIEDAVARITPSAFEASGQQCISTQRILVEEPVFESFLEKFETAASKMKVGDPRDRDTDLGPVVSSEAADRIEAMIEEARTAGARILGGPQREGCTIRPTIIVNPERDARVVREEIFGPVAVVIKVRDLDDALAVANDSEFGLQGSCFTSSLETAFRVSNELRVGSLWINEEAVSDSTTIPSAGWARADTAVKACATPWKSAPSGSSRACAFPGTPESLLKQLLP
ncbi:aldehyde dehydrogenase family protein [Fodinicurvata halophila]